MISSEPYLFSRKLNRHGITDLVLVCIGNPDQSLNVKDLFEDGAKLKDYYSNEIYTVSNGQIDLVMNKELYLLGKPL
jgi:alpha-amylase